MPRMQFGLMIRGQFPRGDNMAARFGELMEQARLADRLGYASITKGSHFASSPLQDLQQIPFLCRVMVEAPHARLNAGAWCCSASTSRWTSPSSWPRST